MDYNVYKKPNNIDSIGILGYLIIVNSQIHNYQVNIIEEYLDSFDCSIFETPLKAIFDDSESKLKLNEAIEAFKDEDIYVQQNLIYLLFMLSHVDSAIDSGEERIIRGILAAVDIDQQVVEEIKALAIENAMAYRESSNTLFTRTKPERKKKWYEIAIEWIVAFFKSLFGIKDNSEELERQSYISAIRDCCKVAHEDFELIKPSYSNITGICEETVHEIRAYNNNLPRDTEVAEEVAKAIDAYCNRIKTVTSEQEKLAKKSFEQKERTIADFTISLLGRTKAGKTTLHTILTNQGRNYIGEGKQRTTRFNRVFQWNLMRIIDTPGIGSPEAEGRTDDDIANSVLGESDIICFVIADDSILKDILEFIERIAELNKPIVILLNHKDNIRPDVKYRRFVADPNKWLSTENETSLTGHVDRIQKYADSKGFGSLIHVYPVFLLAALMSTEDKYADDSDLLWNSSNIESFISSLKVWITQYGTVKRSQTLIDEAVHTFEASRKKIEKAEIDLKQEIQKLKDRKEQKIKLLKSTEKLVIDEVREVLKENFQRLAKKEAYAFAEEAYDTKDASSKSWKAFVEKIKFEKEVTDEICQILDLYLQKAKETTSNLFEDVYFSIKNSFTADDIKVPFDIDLRSTARIAGGVIGIAATIALIAIEGPIGWVLTGIGILLELGANIFMTREQKRHKEIEKIYYSIRNEIEKNADSEIETTVKSVSRGLQKKTKAIEKMFDMLIEGMERTLDCSKKLNSGYINEIERLNTIYAYRLLGFVGAEMNDYETDSGKIIEVDRDSNGKMKITVADDIPELSTDSLKDVIAESVEIERRKAS